MATQKLNLTRDQLSLFLQNFEQIKQFERLFALADQISPSPDTPGTELLAGTGNATANEALSQIVSLAKDAAINSGNADQKAVQALDALNRISNSLELLSAAPVIENNNSTKTDYVDYDTNAPFINQIARTGWNSQDETLNLGMAYGVVQQIGQETYARVENNTGVTIPEGTVVGFAGVGTGGTLRVSPYLADGATSSLYMLGVMTHDLPDSQDKGYCTVWGSVRSLDTSGFSVGDILYASPTVAGGLTNVKPTAPDNVIPVAACLIVDVTDGVIFVRPTIEQMQYYGIFAKTADTTPVAANTAYPITFDTTRLSNGIVIGGTTSQIIVPESGLYQFNATLQFISNSAVDKNIWVWFRKNGTDIANSARLVTVSVNGAYTPISINEAVSLAASGYVELVYAASSTNVRIDAVASTAFAPSAPAVVLEVTQVQQ
jgi:hypothetical protein